MKCKQCANYKPKGEAKPTPKTTVTVWNDVGDGVWVKTSYTFSGIPDIKRVIRETLDKGALAVKVECPGHVRLKEDHPPYDAAHIFVNGLCVPGWDYNDKYAAWYGEADMDSVMDDAVAKYLSAQKPQDKPAFKVGDIVVTCHNTVGEIEMLFVYKKAQIRFADGGWRTYLLDDLLNATHDERRRYEDEKYTFTLPGGVRVRAYDDGDRWPITIYTAHGVRSCIALKLGEALCAALVDVNGRRGLPIKKLEPGETPEYPKEDGK